MKDPFQLRRLRAQILFFYTLAIFLRLSSAQYTTDSSDTASQNEAGAAGPSSGSINLSTRDQIVIFTIVGVVVIFGVTSAILYLIAKKRQWKVRASIRRSARRVTEAIKTPLTPKFPKSPRAPLVPPRDPRRDMQQKKDHGDDASSSQLQDSKRPGPRNIHNNSTTRSARSERRNREQPDLEKGHKEDIAPTKSHGSSFGSDSSASQHRRGWGTWLSFGRN
ncbi:hypothetical protein VTN00DRAFT_5052 [Thermoascus crustaceus]|uniref:uncharacterized protein n=1 Tax=Thermoascus crustaceus TaxID=5088 RepID=UPI00374486DB